MCPGAWRPNSWNLLTDVFVYARELTGDCPFLVSIMLGLVTETGSEALKVRGCRPLTLTEALRSREGLKDKWVTDRQ